MERGPGRHGISNAFFLYIRDPDGHRIELFTSDYLTVDPDLEPIRWSLTDPQRQTLWGQPAPKSWFEEGSAFAACRCASRCWRRGRSWRGNLSENEHHRTEVHDEILETTGFRRGVGVAALLLIAVIVFATVYRIYFSRAVALTQVCERLASIQNGENADMFNSMTATPATRSTTSTASASCAGRSRQ